MEVGRARGKSRLPETSQTSAVLGYAALLLTQGPEVVVVTSNRRLHHITQKRPTAARGRVDGDVIKTIAPATVIQAKTTGTLMNEPTVKIPGPEHPISITHIAERVVVTLGRRLLADSTRVIVLREAGMPPVAYLPREDVDMSALSASDHRTYCPYKGDCSYFSIPAGGERSIDAVWTYETPHPAVASIAGHLAFYPDRVDGIFTVRSL